MKKPAGTLIVLTGPSGVGKGTLRKRLMRALPWLKESVSATTRVQRMTETDGEDYFFVTSDRFRQMIDDNELIEWAEYAGNYYGTPRFFLEETLEKGDSLLLEIEVQGALQIRKLFPEARLIFIAPPSMAELETRMRTRNQNEEGDIRRRLDAAQEEMQHQEEFDMVIVNDNLDACEAELIRAIKNLVQAAQDTATQ